MHSGVTAGIQALPPRHPLGGSRPMRPTRLLALRVRSTPCPIKASAKYPLERMLERSIRAKHPLKEQLPPPRGRIQPQLLLPPWRCFCCRREDASASTVEMLLLPP